MVSSILHRRNARELIKYLNTHMDPEKSYKDIEREWE